MFLFHNLYPVHSFYSSEVLRSCMKFTDFRQKPKLKMRKQYNFKLYLEPIGKCNKKKDCCFENVEKL